MERIPRSLAIRTGTVEPLFRLEGVRVIRGEKTLLAVDALTIAPRETVAVVGPNGAGKTTLLRLLAFLVPPDRGRLLFRGAAPAPQGAARALEGRRAVTLVMQHPFLFSGTVLRNAGYGLRARGIPRARCRESARRALQQVGLAGFEDRPARTLSGGEARRLALARALALDPEVLLLDEPTSDLDRESRQRFEETLDALRKEGRVTVVLSTHDRDQALRIAARVLALEGGKIADAHPLNLFRGEIRTTDEGSEFSNGRIRLRVADAVPGPAVVSVDPDVVALSIAPPLTSAKNVLAGRIVEIAEEGAKVRVVLDAGERLAAYLTASSVHALGLHVGGEAQAVFKAHAVKILR